MAGFEGKFHSARQDWETPQELFGPLNAEFSFTLDVAANSANAKCEKYFTEKENGLERPWSGVVWCNPPYGRDVPEWIKKAIFEKENNVTSVLLILAKTNTIWFHELCLKHGEVRFIKGRPKFIGAKHGLPLPLCLVIFRPEDY